MPNDHESRTAAGSSDDAVTRQRKIVAEDIHLLNSLGYGQELLRRMSGFSNFAISLSIICIVAGGITSFPQGFCSVGGAAIGVGWPLCCFLSLCVALAMAQVASAFPTAGGLYHWAAILGGRGWGWLTAWFNLAGLITVLAAINVGTFQFAVRAIASAFDIHPARLGPGGELALQLAGVLSITCAQALFNHLGIRITAALTDFSGYWILLVASALTAAMLAYAPSIDLARLITFTNYSGSAGGDIWPETGPIAWVFLLGFLLPAYTVTGFDASAHTSEETVGASHHVPRGIVRSVLVSGIFGWVMLSAIVLAIPNLDEAAAQGGNAFFWIVEHVLPGWLRILLALGIVVAQFFCGLATVTSASRMAYAFARDGGLPYAERMRHVSPKYRTPAVAIWTVSLLSVAFVVHTPTYSTIAAAGTIFLYISYVMPTTLGLLAYGRSWTQMGPWSLGGTAFRTFSVLSILGCGLILVIGIQPPNEKNLWIVLSAFALTALVWIVYEREHFRGPPQGVLNRSRHTHPEKPEPATAEIP
ncbi:MAG: amino acid permease [Planctomycetia bacterium]|nr:amino acid permease [Planctomycetia bacterium]